MSGPSARRRVVGTAAMVVSVVVPPILVGALATRIGQDLSFGTRELGLALAVCFLITSALSPLGGRVVTRLGAEASLRVAGVMTTVGLVGIAAATRVEHVVLALAFVGIPNALTQPSSNEMLSLVKEPRLRALSFGLVQASIPTASLVAGTLLAVANYATSWRGPVLAVAVATVLAQLVLPRTARVAVTRPYDPTVRRSEVASRVVDPADGAGGPQLMIAVVLTGCLASGAATALPSFAATTGVTVGVTTWLVAGSQVAGSIASIVVRIVAPVVTSHATLARRLGTVALLQGSGVVAMLALASGTPVGFVIGTICAFAFGWGWNGLFNLIVALARPGRVAAATGLTQAGVFFGGAVGPLTFAVIGGDGHVGAGWLAMAIIMTAAVACSTYAAHRARGISSALRPLEEIHS